jgi:hypothetical protein
MRLARRIAVTIVCTLGAIFLVVRFLAPIALSFYAVEKALPVARILPTDLQDHSISQAKGMRLSYVGYEFETPWDDPDESKTQFYPKDKPAKTRAVLAFRSGLRLMVAAIPPREFADGFADGSLGFGKIPPAGVDLLFGAGASKSDYTFVNNVYEFTPDKMNHWSLSERLHVRESILLTVKSVMPSASAETGIFRVQNHDFKGFQQGNPVKHPFRMIATLYSEDGGVEFEFFDQDYRHPVNVTQPEINRIVESLHRAGPGATMTAAK